MTKHDEMIQAAEERLRAAVARRPPAPRYEVDEAKLVETEGGFEIHLTTDRGDVVLALGSSVPVIAEVAAIGSAFADYIEGR